MFRLSDIQKNIFQLFSIMIESGAYIDIAYKQKVYRLEIIDLHTPAPPRKRKPKQSLKNEITSAKCPKCRGLLINGICMAPESHDI